MGCRRVAVNGLERVCLVERCAACLFRSWDCREEAIADHPESFVAALFVRYLCCRRLLIFLAGTLLLSLLRSSVPASMPLSP